MSALAVKHELNLVVQECIRCGILFGVPRFWDSKRREDHQSFYCPNGHSQAYIDGPVERLQKELDAERKRKEFWQNQSQMHEAKAQRNERELKRVKNRVSKGVCPCCRRSFVNLQRHMKTQHPAFNAAPPGEEGEKG